MATETPIEFFQHPAEDQKACYQDLMLFGRYFIDDMASPPRRIPPENWPKKKRG
jgi:hypothetical protein